RTLDTYRILVESCGVQFASFETDKLVCINSFLYAASNCAAEGLLLKPPLDLIAENNISMWSCDIL
ncbi:hypothetical protein FWK35_00023232, partial [Aphis craccivora]